MSKKKLFSLILGISFSLMLTLPMLPMGNSSAAGAAVFSDPFAAQAKNSPANKSQETADWHIEQGDLAAAAGDLKNALKHYQKAMQLDPNNLIAPEKAKRINQRITQDERQGKFTKFLQDADSYYEKKDIRFAFLSLVEALRVYPEGSSDIQSKLLSIRDEFPGEIETLVSEYTEELKDVRVEIDRMLESEPTVQADPVAEEVEQEPEQEIERKQSGLRIGLFTYELQTGNQFAMIGLLGMIAHEMKKKEDMPYYDILRNEMIQTIDEMLLKSGACTYIPLEKLDYGSTGEEIPLEEFLKRNKLDACMIVKAGLGVNMGFSKKLSMRIIWELVYADGSTEKIKVSAKSQTGQGLFPDIGDPNLKPVWLEITQDNTSQFIEKLAEIQEQP